MGDPMRQIACALLMVLLAGTAPAAARTLALIIGNDSYVNIPKLAKARADAAGYGAFFESQGFETTVFTDLDSKSATFALAGFLDSIQPGDTVAFAFSGHGWSDGRENYLLPIDVPASGSETLFKRQSIAVQNGVNGIVDEIVMRGAKLTLVVIDACRNNPFNAGDNTRTVGLSRGLVSEIAPEGTFIAFSAGAGQTALDALSDADPSPYSVFTRHFLAELKKPQDLQTAFKATQLAVNDIARSIGHDQRPAYYDEVVGAACLTGNCVATAEPENAGTGGATSSGDDRIALALQGWQYFKDVDDVVALEAFADEFSDTPIAALARSRIRSLQRAPSEPAVKQPPREPEPPRSLNVRLPSWCPRAATATEVAICNTPSLARLDLTLAEIYSAERANRSGYSRDLLVEGQRNWLKARDRCRADVQCMESLYRRRIEELR